MKKESDLKEVLEKTKNKELNKSINSKLKAVKDGKTVEK